MFSPQFRSDQRIAIVASPLSAESRPPSKRWWDLRRFVAAYEPVLAQFAEIGATEETAAILKAVAPRLKVVPVGPGFQGVVHLAAAVAQRQLRRVLWFQNPGDLRFDRAENYALLRNCNLAGAHLLINGAAHLWALHAGTSSRSSYETRYNTEPVDRGNENAQETVMFIAHDAEKPRMSRFVLHYRSVLRKFPRRLATSGTLKHIEAFLKEHAAPNDRLAIEPVGKTAEMAHGPSGGDVIVADELFSWYGAGGRGNKGEHVQQHILHHILFFADNRRNHPHEADIRVLLKTCVDPMHRVNLILNSRMAEEWGNRYVPSPDSRV